MKLTIPLFLALSLATPALAALPPEHQRHAEINAVLEAAVEALDGLPIDAIEFVEPDRYSVRAGTCTIKVDIVDKAVKQEAGWVGPRQFDAVAGEKGCE